MAGQKENPNDTLYAVLLALAFFSLLGFIATVSFWENLSYLIYKFDYHIASFINYYFSNLFSGYEEVNNLVDIASIPKFDFWTLSFKYSVGNDYVNYINNFYEPLHFSYAFILFILGYLIINNFKIIPMFQFQNYKNYKEKLIEKLNKRLKINNKQIKLYNHMDVLLEKKREPADLGNNVKQFLNADYFLPFIQENEESEFDLLKIDTNKRYINDSLFFSNHYINNYYKFILDKKLDIEDITFQSLYQFDKEWEKLKINIQKNKNIQDLYYYYLIYFFNTDKYEQFINLFLLNDFEINKDYLTKFNNFLKKYNFPFELKRYQYTNNINSNNKIKYIEYTEDIKNLEKKKDLETFIFIDPKNDNFLLNLEEIYILFKIKNYSFLLNKTYFFNSNEEQIQSPITNIPPSRMKDISSANKDEIESVERILDNLKQYKEQFDNLKSLDNIINEYLTTKKEFYEINTFIQEKIKDNVILYIKKEYNKNEINFSLYELLKNEKKFNGEYLLNILKADTQEIDLLVYIKTFQKTLKLYKDYILNNENYINDYIKNDFEEFLSLYKKLKDKIILFLKDKPGKDYFEIKTIYFEKVNKELNNFIENMINNIKLYYKFNLSYNIHNENNIMPEIGQIVMPSMYILSPFEYFVEENQTYFDKIQNLKVQGYKEYILPVFKEIYNNWFCNIEDLVKYYNKKIDENENDFNVSEEEKSEISLKLQLLKREAEKQKESSSSIETKLLNIFQVHKFEETIIIALWKEFTKLENLPTTKLSNLKFTNFILWYALTSIGDINSTEPNFVIGRPFDFNAGLPILLTYELEKKEYNENLKIKNQKHNIEEKE